MLVIREEQTNVFQQAAGITFENQMVEYLTELSPKHCTILGDAQVRRVVRYGLERAESHGLTDTRSFSLYLALMLMLGSNFDADPQLPWAANILGDQNLIDEYGRMHSLHRSAMEYAEAVAGANNKHADAAFERIRKEKIADLPGDSSDFRSTLMNRLNEIYPEKYHYIGKDALRLTRHKGVDAALRYGLSSKRGILIYIVMMFMLGGGFDADPQFPWAQDVLKDDNLTEESIKTDRLYKTALTYLEKWKST